MNRAKLFKNGESQAVRLPKEYRFKGKEVHVRKQGNSVILTPIGDTVDELWAILDQFSEGKLPKRDQPKYFDERQPL